jgi:hypothetical protein
MNYEQQFQEVYNLLNEVITPQSPASGAIAARNDAPRKDFGPVGGNGYPPSMNKKGLLDPYQSHPLATMGDPDRIPSMPYPLENINSFLGDSYVYLNAALTQMRAAARSNPSLSPIFTKEIERLSKEGVKALKCIEDIGNNLTKVANLNY